MIAELSSHARFFMSTEADESVISKHISIIIDELRGVRFRALTLNLVIEAFYCGARGDLGGTTRFNSRNVYIWLSKMIERQQQIAAIERSKEDDLRRVAEIDQWKGSKDRSRLFGKALMLKLSWVFQGKVNPNKWDYFTLDKIVSCFEKGINENDLTPDMI